MICSLKLELFFEAVIRIVLWSQFHWFESSEPFIRVIKPEELWKYQYPNHDSYVTSVDLWIILILFPALFLLTEYFFKQKKDDITGAIKALTLGYGMTGSLTSIVKILVGRPRPDFFYRCFPDGSGSDFTKCSGKCKQVMDGRKSFPSGHASLSFTCMVFMSMYIARKVDIWDRTRGGQSWKLCACIAPLLVSTSIAISRTCDYHHHYEDVMAGSLLGSIVAFLTYWLYFPERTKEAELIAQEK